MKFGVHISIEGGVANAPKRAFDADAECFQIFSRSPHGGKSLKIDEAAIADFKRDFKKYKTGKFFIHSPYYINFASENNRIRYGSISAIRSELEVADSLGASGVVTHLGSSADLGDKAGEKLVEGLCKSFEIPSFGKDKTVKIKYKRFKAKLLLEITAGSGNIMGDTFEEIAFFIKETEKKIGKNVLGVCFDTAHAFASGYDLRTSEAVHRTFADFDKIIGLERIKLVHLNDSLASFNSHSDRHANIGKGKIGIEGIRSVLAELKPYDLDFVLETPPLRSAKDLELLKCLRKELS
jgi:deoxyribonuclease-4